MRVTKLSLKNIGPFKDAHLEFLTDADTTGSVTLITGENGTGKSIILDAIRGMFGERYCYRLERNIVRVGHEPRIEISLKVEGQSLDFFSKEFKDNNGLIIPSNHKLWEVVDQIKNGVYPNWVVDFWRSSLATDSFNIQNLVTQKHTDFLNNSLQGIHYNVKVTELICYFDYLRDSRNPEEQQAGQLLYKTLEKIVEKSLLDGKLSHVARATFDPIVIQNGQKVKLANLSSGNLYLIQRMVSLLGKMHSVHVLRQTPPAEICQTPGLLLIDEAENHLHPKWQKRFIPDILEIFPNLQIIATTHSPFIISSAPNSRIFVCKSRGDHCIVVDETGEYSNKPVEDILLSPLFDATQPFNEEISALIEQRKKAIQAGNEVERLKIEDALKVINPEYFSYFEIDKLLQSINEGS